MGEEARVTSKANKAKRFMSGRLIDLRAEERRRVRVVRIVIFYNVHVTLLRRFLEIVLVWLFQS